MFYSRLLGDKSTVYSEYLGEYITDLLDLTFQTYDYMMDVFVVTKDYVARPDLISYDIYGDDMYQEIILKANGISNPFEVAEGQVLIIPSFDYINNFNVSDDKSWHTDDKGTNMTGNNTTTYESGTQSAVDIIKSSTSTSTTTQKKKSDTRKPNQAVVGDRRFNIDKISKIIIY